MKALLYFIFPTILLVGYGKSWDEQYEEWILDPEPYGGVTVLLKIKDVKDCGATELRLVGNENIHTTTFMLEGVKTYQEQMIGNAVPVELAKRMPWTKDSAWLQFNRNKISDITPLEGLTNLTVLELRENNISDLTPLAGLTNLTRLDLYNINIKERIYRLMGLSYSTDLGRHKNNISDISPLVGLTNLEKLDLMHNPITASQKAILEKALPNTEIIW